MAGVMQDERDKRRRAPGDRMQTITPVLLAGGSGTRLWPVSRKRFPKQFAPLMGDETLFQASARRLSGEGFGAPMVLTASDFRFIVMEQLEQAGIAPGQVVIEPLARNTAPAILAAALMAAAEDPDRLLLVAPSDHVIPDFAGFAAAVRSGTEAARAGRIVTFGITPDRPETGYGYLELAGTGEGPQPLARFVEKPDAGSAARMLEGKAAELSALSLELPDADPALTASLQEKLAGTALAFAQQNAPLIDDYRASISRSTLMFWAMAILVGTVQGGIQAVSRSYFGKLVPKKRSNEYFGFFDIFGKFATFVGPLLYALIGSLSGRSSFGTLALLALFLAGFLTLIFARKPLEQLEQRKEAEA